MTLRTTGVSDPFEGRHPKVEGAAPLADLRAVLPCVDGVTVLETRHRGRTRDDQQRLAGRKKRAHGAGRYGLDGQRGFRPQRLAVLGAQLVSRRDAFGAGVGQAEQPTYFLPPDLPWTW